MGDLTMNNTDFTMADLVNLLFFIYSCVIK